VTGRRFLTIGPIIHYGRLICGPRSTWELQVNCEPGCQTSPDCWHCEWHNEQQATAIAAELAERAAMWGMPD